MTLSKTAALRGIQDAKIAALTLDDTSSLTYGTFVDVPIKDFSCTGNYDNYELKHDDEVQEIDTQVKSYDLSFSIARASLDVLSAITGATVANSGSSTTEKQTMSIKGTDAPGYFKLEVQSTKVISDSSDVKDVHIVFPKCKIQSIDLSVGDDFAAYQVKAKAIRTKNNAKIKDVVFNASTTAIA